MLAIYSHRTQSVKASGTRTAMLQAWKRRIAVIAGVLVLSAACNVHAQAQRSFVNPSFETPVLPGTACWSIRESADVPGWETTEPSYNGTWNNTSHGSCGGHPDLPVVGAMQIFKNGWDSGLVATDGEQWAELNAFTARRLYQNVCMANGERVDWSLAHRGRGGTQVMQFNIGPNPDGTGAQAIVQARSSTTGGSIDSCGLGTCTYDGAVNTWGTYSGNFIWNGPSGMQTIGFESLTGGSTGNYLDNIRLTLRPYIEFYPANGVTAESAGSTGVPALRVAGVIAVPLNITVAITGGTAVLGTDYSAPGTSFIVSIPAGDYGERQDFPLPLAAIGNSLVEDNRTVELSITEDPANYAIGSTSACGAPANAEVVWTIVDDDVDLVATKAVDADPVMPGDAFEYTVTFANNTARPTVEPLDAHDVTAAVADALPAGLAFDAWTCQASGGASCPGGASNGSTSGSGAIAGNAVLPAGEGIAGGQIVYTINARYSDPASCAGVTNTASIATPGGLQEGDGVGGGFATPVPGGTGNNSAGIDVRQACADLQIEKSVTPDDVAPGAEVVYTLVATNHGPLDADNAVISDPGVPGSLTCTAVSCAATGGATCPAAPTPAQLVTGLAIPTFPVDAQVTLEMTCTVTATGTP